MFNNKISATADLILNLSRVDYATTTTGIVTILLIFAFERTPAKKFAYLIALVLVSIAVVILPDYVVGSVQLVRDIGSIPNNLPMPTLPELQLIPSLIAPAVAIGIIALLQGVGVSQSFPNPDGKFPNP